MVYFVPFYLDCRSCGRIFRPHKSPREGVRLALLGQARCNCCGALFPKGAYIEDRPMVRQVREYLKSQGLLK